MKKVKIIVLSVAALAVVVAIYGFSKSSAEKSEKCTTAKAVEKTEQKQTINLFVTHGHCNTPFAGSVNNLKVETLTRDDGGNPLEGLKISFEIDPETFTVCANEQLTEQIKTPGLFIGKKDEKIRFTSSDVYTVGLNWYQLNGKMSIKGVERDVKFFVSGIRDPKESISTALILESQVNLLDWGIDYDKIVNGESIDVPTKMMHLNMKIDLD